MSRLLVNQDSPFVAHSIGNRAGVACPKCLFILVDPVQTDCGHRVCKLCARSSFLCPECGQMLTGYNSDKAAQSEVNDLPTKCFSPGCLWQGVFANLEKHLTVCPLGDGVLWLCPECSCTFYLHAKEGHLRECTAAEAGPAGFFDRAAVEYSGHLWDKIQARLSMEPRTVEQHLSTIVQTSGTSLVSRALRRGNENLPSSIQSFNKEDGSMIWKIAPFSQQMKEARSGMRTCLTSPPFLSGQQGYKMCLRLYILGDGIGKGTHMSLFFVVMKGEFDAILQWPFTHKVSFRLINQRHGRDIVDDIQPDPQNSSFQRPKTDMNIASGCPRFISLTELNQGGFIMDDTIFIKVKVDTSTIQHP